MFVQGPCEPEPMNVCVCVCVCVVCVCVRACVCACVQVLEICMSVIEIPIIYVEIRRNIDESSLYNELRDIIRKYNVNFIF